MLSRFSTLALRTLAHQQHAFTTVSRSNSSLAVFETPVSGSLGPYLFRPTAQVVELGGGPLASIDYAVEALNLLTPPQSIIIPIPRLTLELTQTPWLAGGRRFDLLASDQQKGFTREELLRLIAGIYEGEWALARQWREVDELERAKGEGKAKKQIPLPDVSRSMFESLRLDSSAEYDPVSRVLRPRVLLEVE
ncbi:hypothetical protein BCR35DRAFT_331099 [Leucosporidium creatinivorum]|uniref:Uncharacterized protein n=1 Tax=Leucosporidium creatinivorum TaxID=106004 RepID=A0A1Y2FN60_9BASI|nr:hypothetical protein BCR35DRAFT_331099 [Leucosporidium creatinivorum]